jgi:hypothetical protein
MMSAQQEPFNPHEDSRSELVNIRAEKSEMVDVSAME